MQQPMHAVLLLCRWLPLSALLAASRDLVARAELYLGPLGPLPPSLPSKGSADHIVGRVRNLYSHAHPRPGIREGGGRLGARGGGKG